MGPPSLPLFLSPSLPPSFLSWQWKKMPQNRRGVGGKGEEGGKVDRAKKKESKGSEENYWIKNERKTDINVVRDDRICAFYRKR